MDELGGFEKADDLMAGAQMPPPEETPSPMPLLSTMDTEIRDMIMGRKGASEKARLEKVAIWDRCWQNYKQVPNGTGKQTWQQNTFQPATPRVVEDIVANLHSAVMGPDRPVEYQARLPDFEQHIRDVNDLIQVDFDKSKFKAEWTDFLRTLCICGTGVAKVDYVKQKEKVMVKERVKPILPGFIMKMFGGGAPTQEKFVEKEVLVKDHARIVNKDPYMIFNQPGTTEITADTWIIEKARISNRDLIKGASDQDPYFKLKNVTPELLAGGAKNSIQTDTETQIRQAALQDSQVQNHFLDPDREHDLLEYWGPVPLKFLEPEAGNDPSRQYDTAPAWIWLVDGQFVVRCVKTPFRDGEPPYIKGVYIRVPGQWHGIGPAELILGLQVEKNELRNTRMDNVNLILNKIIAVLKDKVADTNRLVSGPGAIWTFKGIDDVRKALYPVEMPDITKDAYLASAEVDREIQEVTAAGKSTQTVGAGEDQAGNGTFRGQLLNQNKSSERFMLYARVLEICGLQDGYRKFYQRIYQYKDWADAETVLGPKRSQAFKFLDPETLDRVGKIVAMGVLTMENKGVKLAQMMEFVKAFQMAPWCKTVEIARRIWIEMGFPDSDVAVMSDDELTQYNEMKRQLLNEAPPPAGPDGAGKPPQKGGSSKPSPVAGNVPGPTEGMPRPAMQPRGPGAATIDGMGMPA